MTQALWEENESLRSQVAALRMEQQRLTQVVEALRREQQQREQQAALVERQMSHLVRVRVASHRLHETLDAQELLAILQDLVVNLVGSEMLGIFEVDARARTLVLECSLGIDEERWRRLPLERDCPIARTARTGVPFVPGRRREPGAPGGEEPFACMPLRLGSHVLGVLVLFDLLPHKEELEPTDRELLEVLASEAARGLFCARALAGRGLS
jgi:GAF domain-containing protein